MTEKKIAKYLQIERDIIQNIKEGLLKPGDKVESESMLKKRYKVSAITVRKAFTDLINDGYLYGVQGVGTFVAKKQMIRGLTSVSFSEELEQQGYRTKLKLCSIEATQNKTIAQKLGLNQDAQLILVKRVRYADGNPIAYHSSYLSADVLPIKIAREIKQTHSLYKTLASLNVSVSWVNENYSVKEIIDEEICKEMNVNLGYPSFFVKRTSFDDIDEIIEYAETYFNNEFYSVTVNINA